MLRFIINRLAASLVLLLLVSFGLFAMLAFAPGDPLTVLTGGRSIPPEQLEYLRQYYHLDQSMIAQYLYWLSHLLHGDLGLSMSQQSSVWDAIQPRIAPTLELAVYGGILVLIFGFGAGVLAGIKRGKAGDAVLSGAMLAAASVAPYISGVLLIVIFAEWLGWFPIFGSGDGPLDQIRHLTLPAVALAISLSAFVGRISRAAMIDALGSDYVDTAKSRGMSWGNVHITHALRTASVPIVTVGGITAGYLVTGAIVIEYTFGLNGLGSALVQGILAKDYALVQAIALIFVLIFILANLMADIAVMLLDPRLRVSRGLVTA